MADGVSQTDFFKKNEKSFSFKHGSRTENSIKPVKDESIFLSNSVFLLLLLKDCHCLSAVSYSAGIKAFFPFMRKEGGLLRTEIA